MDLLLRPVKALEGLPPDTQLIVVEMQYGNSVILPFTPDNMRAALLLHTGMVNVTFRDEVGPAAVVPKVRVMFRDQLTVNAVMPEPPPDPAAEDPF